MATLARKAMELKVILTRWAVQTWMNIYYQMNWSWTPVWWAKEDGVNYDHALMNAEFGPNRPRLSMGITWFWGYAGAFTPEELNDFATECVVASRFTCGVYGDRSLEFPAGASGRRLSWDFHQGGHVHPTKSSSVQRQKLHATFD